MIRKQGGYVRGIRPGYPTERHLQNILYRITLPGALFLALVALLPSIFLALWNIQNYPFAGTDAPHCRRRGAGDDEAGRQPAHVARLRGLPAIEHSPRAPLIADPERQRALTGRPGRATPTMLGRQGSGKGTQANAPVGPLRGAPHLHRGRLPSRSPQWHRGRGHRAEEHGQAGSWYPTMW